MTKTFTSSNRNPAFSILLIWTYQSPESVWIIFLVEKKIFNFFQKYLGHNLLVWRQDNSFRKLDCWNILPVYQLIRMRFFFQVLWQKPRWWDWECRGWNKFFFSVLTIPGFWMHCWKLINCWSKLWSKNIYTEQNRDHSYSLSWI